MTRTEILDKIAALLSLANGNASEHEAAAAMAAAQRLMAKHEIDQASIDGHAATPEEVEIEHAEDAILDASFGRNLPGWRAALAGALASVHGCTTYQTTYLAGHGDRRVRLHIIGAPSDAGLVRYMYAYAAHQIDQACAVDMARLGGSGKSWAANYRLAAARRVAERVRESARKAKAEAAQGATGTALALVTDRREALAVEIKGMERKLGLRSVSRSGPAYDAHAREAGRRAGDRVDLAAGGKGGALGAGVRGALR